MTEVQGDVVWPIALNTFADITDAPLVLSDGRVGRNRLLFDGDLTAEQVEAIWWRMTSRDAADETARRNIAALRLTDLDASPLALALAAYLLGET